MDSFEAMKDFLLSRLRQPRPFRADFYLRSWQEDEETFDELENGAELSPWRVESRTGSWKYIAWSNQGRARV